MPKDFRANLDLEIKRWRLDAGLETVDQLSKPEQHWKL